MCGYKLATNLQNFLHLAEVKILQKVLGGLLFYSPGIRTAIATFSNQIVRQEEIGATWKTSIATDLL